jgi:hypothetical protein
MRLLLAFLAACGGGGTDVPGVDASESDAAVDAPPPDAPEPLFAMSGMCGVLNAPELTGANALFVRDTMTFSRRYNDPADRGLLTPGGRTIVETPNAGGSSIFSEVFAFEQLAACEVAGLLKTETQIVYDAQGSITDILVEVDGLKIGVSVVRAVQFPFGQPYTVASAMPLITRKLEDIQESTMNVSAGDRWVKQILAVLAYDDQHVDIVEQVWNALDPSVRADTIVVATSTAGDDMFIYTNQ